jgi:hypothetical protein
MAPTTDDERAAWYKAKNDILPTKERLHRIHMTPNDACRNCDMTDTLMHRLT